MSTYPCYNVPLVKMSKAIPMSPYPCTDLPAGDGGDAVVHVGRAAPRQQ